MRIATYYHKAMIAVIDAHLGRKTRRLMTMKLEAQTLAEEVRAINFETELEAELAEFQNLITEHKRDLRLTGRVKQREAA